MTESNFDINTLLREHLKGFKPYSSARSEYTGSDAIFLDANENPLGSASGQDYNRYPNPYNTHIRQKAAALRNVVKEQVFMGNGSDEAIDLLYRAFCEPGRDNVIICPPTYGMYETSAQLNNVALREVLLIDDFQLDLEAIHAAIDANSKMIFLCSPNNPTGNLLHSEDIKWVLKTFPGLVVIDEAYIDFSPAESWVSRLDQYPNLVVLQTLSKAWGMAGIRVGMAFASPEIIKILMGIKPPYNISTPAHAAAMQAMCNETQKQLYVKEMLVQLNRMTEALKRQAYVLKVYHTDANFVLVKVENPNHLYQYLVERKVVVRNRNTTPKCEGCLRISVGTREETDLLIKYLDQYPSTVI